MGVALTEGSRREVGMWLCSAARRKIGARVILPVADTLEVGHDGRALVYGLEVYAPIDGGARYNVTVADNRMTVAPMTAWREHIVA